MPTLTPNRSRIIFAIPVAILSLLLIIGIIWIVQKRRQNIQVAENDQNQYVTPIPLPYSPSTPSPIPSSTQSPSASPTPTPTPSQKPKSTSTPKKKITYYKKPAVQVVQSNGGNSSISTSIGQNNTISTTDASSVARAGNASANADTGIACAGTVCAGY